MAHQRRSKIHRGVQGPGMRRVSPGMGDEDDDFADDSLRGNPITLEEFGRRRGIYM